LTGGNSWLWLASRQSNIHRSVIISVPPTQGDGVWICVHAVDGGRTGISLSQDTACSVACHYMCAHHSPKLAISYRAVRHGRLNHPASPPSPWPSTRDHTRARKSINRVKFVKLIPAAALGICGNGSGERTIDRSDVW